MTDRQFYPGQKVRVVSNPVKCVYGWADGMDQYCGQELTVRTASQIYTTRRWLIELEGIAFMWDANCFVDGKEPTVSVEEVNNLL